MTTTRSLDGEQRRQALLGLLERDGRVQHDTAASSLGVSAMTIRRDLADMEETGLVRRVRGGALPTAGPRPFRERRASNTRAKAAIAQKALWLVPDGGAIALDASSTTGQLGRLVGGRSELTVATNSWENHTAVRRGRGAQAVLIGGELEEATDSFVGPLAGQAAASLLYRRFFASASAVDPAVGSSEVTLAEAAVKREFARVAEQTILCVDASKLAQRDIAACLDWSQVAVLVTELEPGDPRLEPFRTVVEVL